jgi:hypothetical protein
MKIFATLLLILLATSACGRSDPPADLPGGYKVWIMNANEIYLANANNELIAGPALRKIGATQRHIVAWCEEPDKAYTGNVRTVGYSVVDLSNGSLSSGLTEEQAKKELTEEGSTFPEMKGFEAYSTAK